MAVTSSGRYVTGDELLVLFAKQHRGRTIVCPVDATKLVEDATGCRVVRTRVGDAFVSETLAAEKGAWGGDASGAWIFPDMSYCPDGPLAAATLCHLVANDGPLDPQLDQFDEQLARFSAAFSDGDVTTLDGVRASYEDGWVLVCGPAARSPRCARATVEATDARALERLQARVLAVLGQDRA